MKILILGHARHGKDTVAEMLCEMTGLKFTSSSHACLDVIAPVVELVTGETDKEKMFEQRTEHRELWKRLIGLYTANDKAALARKILETSDVYVGMRCPLEYEASKHLFDAIVWVDATGRLGTVDSTMGIERDCDMIHLNNAGSIRDLLEQVKWLKSLLCLRSASFASAVERFSSLT